VTDVDAISHPAHGNLSTDCEAPIADDQTEARRVQGLCVVNFCKLRVAHMSQNQEIPRARPARRYLQSIVDFESPMGLRWKSRTTVSFLPDILGVCESLGGIPLYR
jgi:hypothetical protein